MANAAAGGIRSPVFKMQFGAYSDDGDKLQNPIEQGSSSWRVNNLKQSGLSASAPLVQMVVQISVSRGEIESAISSLFFFPWRSYVFLVFS
jgi:hypothetical protein